MRRIAAFVLAVAALAPAAAAAEGDPLPSWRDGKAKAAIVDFVAAVSDPSGPDYVPEAERIAVFDNDGKLWAEHLFRSIAGKGRFHETQKPLALMRRLIRKHSRPGDLVVDPFAGSGTTGVAALMEGRRFAGCEPNDQYFPKAHQRVMRDGVPEASLGQGPFAERQERFARSYADRKVAALRLECADPQSVESMPCDRAECPGSAHQSAANAGSAEVEDRSIAGACGDARAEPALPEKATVARLPATIGDADATSTKPEPIVRLAYPAGRGRHRPLRLPQRRAPAKSRLKAPCSSISTSLRKCQTPRLRGRHN